MFDLSKNKGRKWTNEEVEYLKDNYGEKKTKVIAKELNRTVVAVRKKARLIFPSMKFHEIQCNYSLADLANTFGVKNSVIIVSWIRKRGMPVKKHKSKKAYSYVVKLDNFWEWLEENRDNVTIYMSKVDLNVLEYYPEWFLEDYHNNTNYYTKGRKTWGEDETQKLIHLYYSENKTAQQIADILGRSLFSVKTKLERELEKKLTKVA